MATGIWCNVVIVYIYEPVESRSNSTRRVITASACYYLVSNRQHWVLLVASIYE